MALDAADEARIETKFMEALEKYEKRKADEAKAEAERKKNQAIDTAQEVKIGQLHKALQSKPSSWVVILFVIVALAANHFAVWWLTKVPLVSDTTTPAVNSSNKLLDQIIKGGR